MENQSPDVLQSLLRGCLKNDRKSQRELYRLFYSYGMSMCLRYADHRDEAAETLNEAFMNVFKNLGKFDFARPFKPWFRKILINSCINNFKKKNIRFTEDVDAAANSAEAEKILSGIAYDEILEMIRKLSPAYRAVFNLYVIEGYKHEEIADILEISVGTSKSNLAKARKNLQEILKLYFKEDYERVRQ
ncbi:MAG: RNA polymerase sigma factor [Cyclobacteriaceae bacterium]|nr:RNA polymerase sigma factor [Cyclobacteriaceae bacterium]